MATNYWVEVDTEDKFGKKVREAQDPLSLILLSALAGNCSPVYIPRLAFAVYHEEAKKA